jgi:hypothetical protein
MTNTADNFGYTARATSQDQNDLSVTGVSILGFKSESIAREAGMQKGDVMVEYDGKGNLTTDKLMALTTVTKPEGTQTRVVFMRDGHERSTRVPSGPLGISASDKTVHTSSEQDFGDVSFSDGINRFKKIGLGTLGAYLVLVLLTLGGAAVGFLPIDSWGNLAIVVFMLSVPAIVIGFLYYLIGEFLSLTGAQMAVNLLFLGWVVVTLELMRRSQDSSLIVGFMILSGAAFFVLLYGFIHYIPSLREGKGTLFGTGIGMWTGIGISYALWGPNWYLFPFRYLVYACILIGGYLGHKIVDKKSGR